MKKKKNRQLESAIKICISPLPKNPISASLIFTNLSALRLSYKWLLGEKKSQKCPITSYLKDKSSPFRKQKYLFANTHACMHTQESFRVSCPFFSSQSCYLSLSLMLSLCAAEPSPGRWHCSAVCSAQGQADVHIHPGCG